MTWTLCFAGVADAWMCVQCNSERDQNPNRCENDPPPATQCHYTSDSFTDLYCSIIRQYDGEGKHVSTIRDCTTTNVKEPYCDNMDDDNLSKRICYFGCHGDGCNSSTLKQVSIWTILICPFIAISISLR
ncbi:hypothetical protein CAPTEDRAFT_200782 [Capitella teleta]|uniref:Protein sleepless n=1 Tax=Capitella teleta TaxID=283909 RepID=R7T5G7_CAPTE|nr:hypothetical protein CAPTEDRAFT_200782 [Capitella teleta]|eukprot:ELT88266.1 hypothetical protein CAPTEDRAFT_200782 [Capitella teleta]